MSHIEDTGKVWIPGNFRPEYAVRVGKQVFVVGQEAGETVECWVSGSILCVDRHHEKSGKRLALMFELDTPPNARGTLFEGFTLTPHGDVPVVHSSEPTVRICVVEGMAYQDKSVALMAGAEFFNWAGLSQEQK
jgi:hypothetical protein